MPRTWKSVLTRLQEMSEDLFRGTHRSAASPLA